MVRKKAARGSSLLAPGARNIALCTPILIISLLFIPDSPGASKYRKVRVTRIKSNSYLGNNPSYAPGKLLDGKTSTAWCEGGHGYGIDESVTVFLGRRYRVVRIELHNGYQSPAYLGKFRHYSRVAMLTVKAGSFKMRVKIPDRKLAFAIRIPSAPLVDRVKLTIDSVHRGKVDHTCMSELSVFTTAADRRAARSRKRRSDRSYRSGRGNANGLSATATSWLHQNRIPVSPAQAVDGATNTAWCEGVDKKPGIGVHLDVRSSTPMRIRGIRLVNGYAKRRVWITNNRVRRLKVTVGGRAQVFYLANRRTWQFLRLRQPVLAQTVRLTIMSVYPGTKYNDTCISEVRPVAGR